MTEAKKHSGQDEGLVFSHGELCAALDKGQLYVRNLQRSLGLEAVNYRGGYSAGYVRFMEKIVALRTFSVPLDDICELFEAEKKILKLLHLDGLGGTRTWFLDAAPENDWSENCLLLTGIDLGFHLSAQAVQTNLDFQERHEELFKGAEMGEDIIRCLGIYTQLAEKIRGRVRMETPVLKNALAWAKKIV